MTDNRVFLVLGLLTLVAAQRQPPAAADAPAVKKHFADRAAAHEAEIARRMLQRPEAMKESLQRLELEIDVRFVARWLNAQAANAPLGSELQVAARLRDSLWETASTLLIDAVDKQGGRLTQPQLEATARLHQLTFTLLGEAKSVKDIDDVSRKLGLVVASFLSVDERLLVRMRPAPIRAPRNGTARPPPGDAPAGAATEVSVLNVSPQLRAQLLALSRAAKNEAERDASLAQTFDVAMDLARGLQMNTGVDPADRTRMEHQLAEAIALFLDPRTRALGSARINGMSQYRTLLARVRRLNLSPEQTAQLAPLIQWVNDNADAGGKVLASLDRAGQYRARFDARPKAPNPIQAMERASGELARQFTTAADAFSRATLDLPRPGSAATPAELEARAEEMHRTIELLERLDAMPATLDFLNSFKPRPAGALDRRVVQLALAASAATATPVRAEAAESLAELARLTKLAQDLTKVNLAELAPLEKRWTGGRVAALDLKWRTILAEQLTAFGTGQKLDPAKVARLTQAMSLLDAFRDGATMDVTLAEAAEPLSRWIDWRLTIEDLKPILLPYPSALAEAYAGYISDTPITYETWTKIERRYRPLVQLIVRDAPYRVPCATLPTGAAAVAAGLATPVDGAPFAQERFAGYCIWLWHNRTAAGDLTGANEAINMLNRRLGE